MKKVLVILSGGYNVRNFIYSGFLDEKPKDVQVVFWHTFNAIEELKDSRQETLPELVSGKLDWIKRTINIAELYRNYKTTGRKSYLNYIVLPSEKKKAKLSLKIRILKKFFNSLAVFLASERGVKFLNSVKIKYVRKSEAYAVAKKKLLNDKPDFIFFTHQRASDALGVSVAASDLKIKTACFIYSWDNLPKGNLYIEADSYFVWSNYMKKEFMFYYPKMTERNIIVTGSPQFIHYRLDKFSWTREEFCNRFNLNINNKYICFSGNDKTTCPVDPLYLDDIAKAVRELKEETNTAYHILFRPNPIDRNDKFDEVLKENKDIITELSPSWEGEDIRWNKGLPNYMDMLLLKNTIQHSELIINMGSTMSMDAALLDKPAIYIRYDVPSEYKWTVENTYNFIHFDALKGIDSPVIWLKNQKKVKEVLKNTLISPNKNKQGREQWVKRIINHPIENANKNIWKAIKEYIYEI